MPPKITVIAPSLASHLRICRELEEARLSQNPKAVEVSRTLLSIITTTAQQRNFQIFSPRKLSAFEVLKKRDLTGCTFYHPVLLTQPRKIFTESDLVLNANVAKIVNPVWLKKAYKMKVPTVSSIIACEGDKSVLSVASCKISSFRTFGTLLLFLRHEIGWG